MRYAILISTIPKTWWPIQKVRHFIILFAKNFTNYVVCKEKNNNIFIFTILGTINDDNEDFEDRAYIAAKFLQQSIKYRFVLGDGLNYEGFINRKLKPDTFYKVFVRAYVDVPQKHLYTSSPFSPELNLNMMQEPSGPVPGRPKPGKHKLNFFQGILHFTVYPCAKQEMHNFCQITMSFLVHSISIFSLLSNVHFIGLTKY